MSTRPPDDGLEAFAPETDAPPPAPLPVEEPAVLSAPEGATPELFVAPAPSRSRWRAVVVAIAVAAAALASSIAWARWTPAGRTPAGATVVPEGVLRVDTDPHGAAVHIDNVARGVTPLAVRLPAGRYEVAVSLDDRAHRMPVTIAGGSEVQQYVAWVAPAVRYTDVAPAGESTPAPPPAGVAQTGWVQVTASVPLDVFLAGRFLGSGRPVPLRAGEHELTFTAPALGFTTAQRVRVRAGETTRVAIDLPRVPVYVNAMPWADVSADGRPIGQTPIGDLQLPIGPHVLEFSHPSFATRQQRIIVSLLNPSRVAVDMRAP